MLHLYLADKMFTFSEKNMARDPNGWEYSKISMITTPLPRPEGKAMDILFKLTELSFFFLPFRFKLGLMAIIYKACSIIEMPMETFFVTDLSEHGCGAQYCMKLAIF